MEWQGKTILITGAGGFMGSHLCERLAGAGARIRALVHDGAGRLARSPYRGDLALVCGDIADIQSVRAAVQGVEIVFHLAALSSVPRSYEAPDTYLQTNIGGTLNVLRAAREAGVRRVVYVSSSAVYGPAQYLPIDEEHPLQAQSPYAASKIGAEKFVEAFYRSFDLPAVILRPFNTFGPGQSMQTVVSAIITQCLDGPVVRLGNIHPTRDLSYIDDTIAAIAAAAAAPGAAGRAINIASGRECSIGDLARLAARLVARDITIETEAGRQRPAQTEINRVVGSSQLARELLGWAPKISLEEGLSRTIAWMRDG